MELQKAVAVRIEKLLNEHNLTRYALCKKIAMPEANLKRILDGEHKNIQLNTLANIAKGFDLSIEEFFHDPMFSRNEIEL